MKDAKIIVDISKMAVDIMFHPSSSASSDIYADNIVLIIDAVNKLPEQNRPEILKDANLIISRLKIEAGRNQIYGNEISKVSPRKITMSIFLERFYSSSRHGIHFFQC